MKTANATRLCRDENCERFEVHYEHECGVVDDSEQDDDTVDVSLSYWPTWVKAREAVTRRAEAPWRKSAPKALDHSIAKSISRTYPKPFHVILRDVEEDYGEVNPRTAQRRLKKLVERGHFLRIDLGRRLYAYLRPGSTLVHDTDLMREQLDDLVMQ
jgi:hypothetical protein